MTTKMFSASAAKAVSDKKQEIARQDKLEKLNEIYGNSIWPEISAAIDRGEYCVSLTVEANLKVERDISCLFNELGYKVYTQPSSVFKTVITIDWS